MKNKKQKEEQKISVKTFHARRNKKIFKLKKRLTIQNNLDHKKITTVKKSYH